MSAAKRATRRCCRGAHQQLLSLERCVTDAVSSGDPLIYDELMRAIDPRTLNL